MPAGSFRAFLATAASSLLGTLGGFNKSRFQQDQDVVRLLFKSGRRPAGDSCHERRL